MQAVFVDGVPPCSKGFFSGFFRFSPCTKQELNFKFHFDLKTLDRRGTVDSHLSSYLLNNSRRCRLLVLDLCQATKQRA